MPDRVRINHQDETFQNSSCTSGAAKTRYQAFSSWVRATRAKLLIWDVETQSTTKVHQAMVGNLVEPATVTPQFSWYAESQIKELSNQVRDLGSDMSTIMIAQKNLQPLNQSQNNEPGNNGHESHPGQGTAEPIFSCRCNSNSNCYSNYKPYQEGLQSNTFSVYNQGSKKIRSPT
jgi:hypothetical protein